ncbi:acetate--CoA ligase family protein [Microbacterium sp. NPDC055683]
MSATGLSTVFAPRGVVVVGASSNPEKLGHAMAASLAGFPRTLQLVNARPTTGMRTSIAEAGRAAGDPLDLAVLCVPAAATAGALAEAVDAGIRSALVCAGGFAEIGEAGERHAADVRAVVRESGMRLVGPNTSGFFVPREGLHASFVPGVRGLRAGSIAVVAASGGVNHALAFRLDAAGAGISLGIGVGAGEDVTAADVLSHLVEDEATTCVILHLETVPDGAALLAAVRAVAEVKPVVALVVGRGTVAEFAASHTGALATSWRTTRSLLSQAGAVVVDDEAQAVAAAIGLSGGRAHPRRRPGAALITAQAGPGLIIADRLGDSRVDLPRLSSETTRRLSAALPPLTFQGNPVDTGRPSETFTEVVSAVVDDPAVDIVGIYALTEPVIDLAAAASAAERPSSLPLVLAVDGPVADVADAVASARSHGVPMVVGPTALAHAVEALVADARARSLLSTDETVAPVALTHDIVGQGTVDEIRGKEMLELLGIRTPPRRRCRTRDEARSALRELGAPVAVKLVDAAVLHKSDIGGVVLGIASESELDDALDSLERAGAREFLVERMAPAGVDLVVGARCDPVFGAIVVVGLGGVAAEVLADVAIRSAPLTVAEAASMVDDLAGRELLDGYRGAPTADIDALARVVVAVGAAVAAGAADEIEINPLRATHEGMVALDAVVVAAHRKEE